MPFIDNFPELFPNGIKKGYAIKEIRVSKKTGVRTRRIIVNGVSYTIRPSFVMPYHVAFSVDVEIRDKSSKKPRDLFDSVGDKIWHCYEAESKASFAQRIRRVCEWTDAENLPDVISKPLIKLKKNLAAYSKAYDLPGCHRTSNMVDRLMQRMDRHLFANFYFHGSLQAAELSIRGWALIQNFAPCNPTTIKRHDGWGCPAEWLNKSRYHENWLQNLLASASMGGFRYPPPKPL